MIRVFDVISSVFSLDIFFWRSPHAHFQPYRVSTVSCLPIPAQNWDKTLLYLPPVTLFLKFLPWHHFATPHMLIPSSCWVCQASVFTKKGKKNPIAYLPWSTNVGKQDNRRQTAQRAPFMYRNEGLVSYRWCHPGTGCVALRFLSGDEKTWLGKESNNKTEFLMKMVSESLENKQQAERT